MMNLLYTNKIQNVTKFYIVSTYYNKHMYIGTYPGSHVDKKISTPVLGQFNV
jgi:hypothetical protein